MEDSANDVVGREVFSIVFGANFGSVIGSGEDRVEGHGLFIIKLDLKSIRKFPIIKNKHTD